MKEPAAILLPGFRSDGLYMLKWRFYLEEAGFIVYPFLYNLSAGFIERRRTRLRNKTIKSCLDSFIDAIRQHHNQILLVVHSNGGAVAYRVIRDIDGVIAFNAALDNDILFPSDWCGFWHNYHSPCDKVLVWGSLRPGHRWGTMGRVGYTGPEDLRIVNINLQEKFNICPRHSELFIKGKYRRFDKVFSYAAERAATVLSNMED